MAGDWGTITIWLWAASWGGTDRRSDGCSSQGVSSPSTVSPVSSGDSGPVLSELLDGADAAELAERLNQPVTLIHVWISRARAKARKAWSSAGYGWGPSLHVTPGNDGFWPP